ncbi:MAG TPA: P1 family peptidase [Actinomycetota bacterium]|nr:P1 family peptidase [Actinomycetota bacterium]
MTTQPRARDLGIRIGSGEPGFLNAITDVAGVRVGHQSVIRGDDGATDAIRTGVTAVFPRGAAPWDEPVYAATHILNGYGELIGINSMEEWGILESPIVLTSSQQIGKAFDAAVAWIATKDVAAAEAVMPCVTECDDSWLSAVLERPLTDEDVFAALDAATGGPVEEGCVGSGVGMQCFDFKGGIGTASRVLPAEAGGYTVGVLVMTNHGDRSVLLVDGVRVGEQITDLMPIDHSEGSCIVIVATDAPLVPHQLRRVAQRAGLGLSRGGSYASNGSGEQFIAFSTANAVPLDGRPYTPTVLADGNESWQIISSVFKATIEATEEAVLNAMLAAHTTVGRDGNTLFALPVDRLLSVLRTAGRIPS